MHAKERSQEAEEGKRLGSEPSERGGGGGEREVDIEVVYIYAGSRAGIPPSPGPDRAVYCRSQPIGVECKPARANGAAL